MAAAMTLLLITDQAHAQMGKRDYINGGWQFNALV